MQALKASLVGTPLEGPLDSMRWLLGLAKMSNHPELWELHLDGARLSKVVKRLLRPDSSAVDVGAHIGSFLSLLTSIAPNGRHIAIEPLREKADRLRRQFPHAEVLAVAVSDQNGTAVFETDEALSGYSHLQGIHMQDKSVNDRSIKLEVETRRLDDVLAGHDVALIKLDVEGFELAALRGATQTIAKSRPQIIFECGPEQCLVDGGVSRLDLYNFFVERDYGVYLFADFLFNRGPMKFDEFRRCGIYPFRAFNFLASPNSS